MVAVLLLGASVAWSQQVVSVTPVFPTANDTVTIVFNAQAGNGELAGVTPIYAHTGVITNNSTTPSDWKYVQGNWGTADANVLMTDLGNDMHQIRYHIASYYGVPATDTVKQLAFVFRNAGGTLVGRSADGSDIYYDVYNANSALLARFLEPTALTLAANIGDGIPVSAASSVSATLTIFDNGAQVAQASNATSINHNIMATTPGNHLVELVADNGTTIVRDTFTYVVNGSVTQQAAPAGTKLGLNYINDSTVTLFLHAPSKQYIYVIGDFNDWQLDANYYMKQTPDGNNWWLTITGLTPGEEYAFQYFVDNQLRIADPFSELVLDPNNDQFIPSVTYPNLKPYPTGKTTGIVTVLQPGKPEYQWQTMGYQRPDKENLMVYELLVRDFVARHDYKTLIDTLDYLSNLGINAIELMPVNEFEGNESWGYNPSFHMALDKYYGTEWDFKAFIDACHARGIAVIIDVVYNHVFSQSPLAQLYWDAANFQPAPNSPYLNVQARHPFNVGYDVNHESQASKDWVKRTMRHWIEEYRIDGFRFDLSKGFTQTNNPNNVGAWSAYDQSRVNIIQDYANECWAASPGFYVILEHLGDNSEETVLANAGMMLWGNLNHQYNEATMGWLGSSNFDWISYQRRGWNDPNVVGYMESHDEERLMYKNLQFGNQNANYSTRDLSTALDRMGLGAALFFTIPGPKMMWQFGEVGYDIGINDPCRVCNKPILWNYFTEPDRRGLYDVYAHLLKLRLENQDVFSSRNFQMNVGGVIKNVEVKHPRMEVHALGNFNIDQQTHTAGFSFDGWWYDYMTGDSINVQNNTYTMTLAPGEYRVYTSLNLNPQGTNVSVTAPIEPMPFHLNIYPNPVHATSTVAYYLPSGAEVEAAIYDVTGRRMRTIVQEYQPEGDHYLNLEASDLPRGTYFVRLQVAGQVSTQPFVVTH